MRQKRPASSSSQPPAKRARVRGPQSRKRNPPVQPFFPTGSSMRENKRMRVVEDEFISNVKSSDAFRNEKTLYVNPGQAGTFPWLASIAKQFDKYEFQNLEFYYKPTVSGFASAGQHGKVMLSFDFDAADPPPANKQQVEDRFPHADCMPYEQCRLTIPVSQLKKQDSKYVRPGALPPGTDIKTYDAGVLTLSTQGGDLDADIGELRVRYVVDLFVPVLESENAVRTNFNTTQVYHAGTVTPGDDVIMTPTYGTTSWSPSIAYADPLGIRQTDGTLVVPPGNYVVNIGCEVKNEDYSETSVSYVALTVDIGSDSTVELCASYNNAAAKAISLQRSIVLKLADAASFTPHILTSVGTPVAGASYNIDITFTSI